MVRIGRSNNRSLRTSGNQGLARRVDNQLDAIVDAQAAKFKTALAVDGAVAFIYNKHSGIIPCTCRGFQNFNNIAAHEVGIAGSETQTNSVSFNPETSHRHATAFPASNQIRQVGGLEPSHLDDYFKQRNESIVDKIRNVVDERTEEGFIDDPADDVIDALFQEDPAPVFSGDGDPMKSILASTNLANSSSHAFNSAFVACPICYGAGYVDTWRLYNGERIVLDASNSHAIDIFNDVEIDTDAQPATYSIYDRSHIKWSGVKFPTSWRHLLRLAIFNGGEEISPSAYRLYFVHPSASDTRNPLNYQTLSQLSNSPLLKINNGLDIILEPVIDGTNAPLVITHVEFLFALGHPVRIQVPEADVPNEDEFVDFNLTLTFELPADVEIKENSYIIEGKYTRTWKVSTINRKLTARGKSFGYSVSARALHSFERQFFLMNVLGKPRNPFANNAIRNMDDEDA